jgi:hypothetical protein
MTRATVVSVRVAGSSSWRFEHDDLDILRVALHVRDATRLPVADSAEVPPPLTGKVPDASAGLSLPDRTVAAGQWLAWWRRILDQAVREVRIRRAEDPLEDTLTRIRAQVSGRDEICDLPGFRSLSAAPELQAAALAAFDGYRAWAAGAAPGQPGSDLFEWRLVRDAVHRAAAALGVPVNQMDGVAHVVPVRGAWSYIAGTGCGICSIEAARDPEAAGAFLHELIVSGAS